MKQTPPKIDTRDSTDIFNLALALARHYCPEWDTPRGSGAPHEWDNLPEAVREKKDVGLVLLALMSRLAETVIGQVNRIPEKHLLAFYDFVGIDHRPASAAIVPLTFELAEGKPDAFVPERTRVASSADPAVVFETVEPLTVVPFAMKAAFSVDPWHDTYTDHTADVGGSETGFPLFHGARDVEHALYIADDVLDFAVPISVTLTFKATPSTALERFFCRCQDGNGAPLLSSLGGEADKLKIFLQSVSVPKTEKEKTTANWLVVKPDGRLPEHTPPPQVTELLLDVTASGIRPDSVLVNDSVMDLKKGFYPFGPAPKTGDAFYLSFPEAFAKKGASISLYFAFDAGVAGAAGEPELAWEYWDGAAWAGLDADDGYKGFTVSGELSRVFFALKEIPMAELNGIPGRWMRARITAGSYGDAGGYEIRPVADVIAGLEGDIDPRCKDVVTNALVRSGISLGGVYRAPFFKAPFIRSIVCEVTAGRGLKWEQPDIGNLMSLNGFDFQKIDGLPFSPYAVPSGPPSFNIGLEHAPKQKPVSVYFSRKDPAASSAAVIIAQDGDEDRAASDEVKGFSWQYSSETGWSTLPVEDGSGYFLKSGLLKFVLPSDMAVRKTFGRELIWIRAVLDAGKWYQCPVTGGFFPNTVITENAAIATDELLGSSDGQPNQVFSFASRSILSDAVIEVKEPAVPSRDEITGPVNGLGDDAVRVERNDSGDIREVWVRWREVASLAKSGPMSRHYLIDRGGGTIIFGDGVQGMIPPALADNIVARKYRSGGGSKGNLGIALLTTMKSAIPGIKGVTNRVSASGGADFEEMADLVTRAPYALKTSGRAILREDFEWLARESSPEVATSRCVRDGANIKVIIAPRYASGAIHPDQGLLDHVRQYLQDRALLTITGRIQVAAPSYKKVNVKTAVVPLRVAETALVSDRVKAAVDEYLHPVTGGEKGDGWDFGGDLFISQVASLIEDVAGVDYVTRLVMTIDTPGGEVEASISGTSHLRLADNELPCAGSVTVETGGKS